MVKLEYVADDLKEVDKLKEAVLAESLVEMRLGTIAAPPYVP